MPGRRIRRRGQGYLYRDRIDAGKRLGTRLAAWRDADALVLALPRGGVPVAAEVARELHADLDVLIARKVGVPMQPELAIGAVTADGGLFLDTLAIHDLGITRDHLDRLIAIEREVARDREARFRGDHPFPRIAQRPMIIVDDGLATGATMSAAIHAIRKRRPAHLIAAAPVGSRYACDLLAADVDDVICLYTPEPFRSVGMFYRDFPQVDDAEVERILGGFRGPGTPA